MRARYAAATAALVICACGGSGGETLTAGKPRDTPIQQRLAVAGQPVDEEYVFHDSGDLAAIRDNQSAGRLSVASFSPAEGPVGTIVTVVGTGFSRVPEENQVTLGSAAATTVAAASTLLTLVVPPGATSGAITVTRGAESATSAGTFVVTPEVTITDFTPRIGKVGTTVTVTGANFDPDPVKDSVVIGSGKATLTAASYDVITATVGSASTSGKVRVSNGVSSATSQADFYVVPGTLAASDVEFTGRLEPGATRTVVIGTAGKLGQVIFDAAAGYGYSLLVNGVTLPAWTTITVHDPAGATVFTGSVSAGTETKLTLPTIDRSGTYSIMIRPPATSAGSLAIKLFGDATAALDPLGGATAVSLEPGQNGRCTFTALPGDILALALTPFATTPSGRAVWAQILDPDGASLGGWNWSGPGTWQLPEISVPGTYTLLLRPTGVTAASVGATLSKPLAGKLVADGPAQRYQTTRTGQPGRLTFTGQAGTAFTVRATVSTGFPVSLAVYRPDGTTQASKSLSGGTDNKLDVGVLPVSGTYEVAIVPQNLSVGSVDVWLITQASGVLEVDGPATAFSLVPAQNGRYTFAGTAGQLLGLGFTAVSYTPTGGTGGIEVLNPDGTTLLTVGVGIPGSKQLPRLPSSGTYTVALRPPGTSAATVTLILSQAITGTLPADGTVVRFQTSRPGQPGEYTFAASAGQSLTLAATSTGFPTGVSVTVTSPSGAFQAGGPVSGSRKLDLSSLPATGTYVVSVVPDRVGTGAVDLMLQQQPTGALVIGNPPEPIALTYGQSGRYSFDATAGDFVGVGVADLSLAPATGAVDLTVFKPSGALFSRSGVTPPGGSWQLPVMPESGTYTLTIAPQTTAALSASVLLSKAATGVLVPDAGTSSYGLTRIGQAGRFSFDASAGQSLTLVATASASFSSGISISIYRPEGSQLPGGNVPAGGSVKFELGALPATGTYVVTATPWKTQTGTLDLSLLSQPSDVLVSGDAPKTLALATGQNGRYTFTASAGSVLDLTAVPVSTTPAGAALQLYVLRPDGATHWSNQVSTATGQWRLPALTQTGTYTVAVRPSATAAATFQLSIVIN